MLAKSAHEGCLAVETDRHIGPDLVGKISGRQALPDVRFCPLNRANCSSRICRAASEPGSYGQYLFQVEQSGCLGVTSAFQQLQDSSDQVVVADFTRIGARNLHVRLSPWLEMQPITHIGKCDKALQLMITIRPAPQDAKRQVHLGSGEFGYV